jgi:predicted nucleic acid-binding protein
VTAAVETRRWLIDKSALVRLSESPDASEWIARVDRGLVRIATVTILEVGFSARSVDDLRARLRRPPVSAMPVESMTPLIEARAIEVQELLAGHGHHRGTVRPGPDHRRDRRVGWRLVAPRRQGLRVDRRSHAAADRAIAAGIARMCASRRTGIAADRTILASGRYWDRTSDRSGVSRVLSR